MNYQNDKKSPNYPYFPLSFSVGWKMIDFLSVKIHNFTCSFLGSIVREPHLIQGTKHFPFSLFFCSVSIY